MPAIGIDATIVRSTVREGVLNVPTSTETVGWWPGPRDRPTVLVGHVDSHSGPAVFFRLPDVIVGTDIEVTRGTSSTTFVVTGVQRVAKAQFPSTAVYSGSPRSLRLVTCGGVFDHRTGHYEDNIVVYADMVERRHDAT